MPKRKHPREWTTDEAIHKLFPKRVVKHFKKAATEAAPKGDERRITKPHSD